MVFFTYGVSLKTWYDSGLLNREVNYYKKMIEQYNVEIIFFTYGDSSDRDYEVYLDNIQICPIYERIFHIKNKPLSLLQSFFVPLYFKKELKQTDIYKTNQIWGGWVAVIAKWLYGKPLLVRCGYDIYQNRLNNDLKGMSISRNSSKQILQPLWNQKSQRTGGRTGFRATSSNLCKHWVSRLMDIPDLKNIKNLIIKYTSCLTYNNANHIILTTENISKFVIQTFGVSHDMISILPNWVDTLKFGGNGIGEKKDNRVLFVGRLSVEKNIPLLINSLVGTSLELDIIGDGVLYKSLVEMSARIGVKVNFLGRYPNNKMPEIYNQYSVYVLCSKYEGNPKTLLEAMASGCAVIGTDVPGIRNVIQHEYTGLVVPEEPEALLEAIMRLNNDLNLRVSLGAKARQQIIKENSFIVAVDREYSIYQKMLTS